MVSIGLALLAAVAAAEVVSWYFSRRVQRSIGNVAAAAGQIAAGRHGTRVPDPGLGGVGLLLLAAFVRVEAGSDHAAIDVRWFRQPSLATASISMALATFALFGAMLYGIYYLQFDRGYSPLTAGLLLVWNAAAVMVAAVHSATLAKRYGTRRVCTAGFLILAGSYAAMVAVDRVTPVVVVELLLVLLGVGTGMVLAPTTDLVMTTVPTHRAGAGSAVNSAVRNLGGALGIAVLGSVLATAYRSGIGEALRALPVDVREAAGESIGGTQAAVAAFHPQLDDHGARLLEAASGAFTDAMHVTASVSSAVVLLALVLVLVAIWMPEPRGISGR